MSKRDFLDNVRVARNLFVHPRVYTDSRHLDPAALTQTLVRAAIWLTPSSVKGFRADEFPEIGPDRQRELAEAIRFQEPPRSTCRVGTAHRVANGGQCPPYCEVSTRKIRYTTPTAAATAPARSPMPSQYPPVPMACSTVRASARCRSSSSICLYFWR